MTLQIIEIQRHAAGWQVYGIGAALMPPFFTGPSALEHAIAYARENIEAASGEIRVLARNGELITLTFFGGTRQRDSPCFLESARPSTRTPGKIVLS